MKVVTKIEEEKYATDLFSRTDLLWYYHCTVIVG